MATLMLDDGTTIQGTIHDLRYHLTHELPEPLDRIAAVLRLRLIEEEIVKARRVEEVIKHQVDWIKQLDDLAYEDRQTLGLLHPETVLSQTGIRPPSTKS
jgi:hypothetical protein